MISYLLCTDEFTITCSREFRIYHLSNDLPGYTESSKVREQHILLNHVLINLVRPYKYPNLHDREFQVEKL